MDKWRRSVCKQQMGLNLIIPAALATPRPRQGRGRSLGALGGAIGSREGGGVGGARARAEWFVGIEGGEMLSRRTL